MLSTLKPNRRTYHRKGWWAEIWVSVILRCKGYQILERRFRCPLGEIDLIVKQGTTLIAIEVKKRTTFKSAVESITLYQQRRIIRALQWYGAKSSYSFDGYRFDAVVVFQGIRWHHLKNAWQIS